MKEQMWADVWILERFADRQHDGKPRMGETCKVCRGMTCFTFLFNLHLTYWGEFHLPQYRRWSSITPPPLGAHHVTHDITRPHRPPRHAQRRPPCHSACNHNQQVLSARRRQVGNKAEGNEEACVYERRHQREAEGIPHASLASSGPPAALFKWEGGGKTVTGQCASHTLR